jgi:hypothetical protein
MTMTVKWRSCTVALRIGPTDRRGRRFSRTKKLRVRRKPTLAQIARRSWKKTRAPSVSVAGAERGWRQACGEDLTGR